MDITTVQFSFKEMIRQQWTDLAAENKVVQKAELKDDIKQSSTEYWKYLQRCIGKNIGITRDQQGSLPGTHRGEYSHFYTLKRGTPTSTASTRTTWVLEEQSPSTP